MEVDNNAKKSLELIQMYEQSLQSLLSQKQNFSIQLSEFQSALSEIEKTDKAYKIVGNIMIADDKEKIKKEVSDKKEMYEIRIKSIEKQEDKIREKISEAQKEVMKGVNEKNE